MADDADVCIMSTPDDVQISKTQRWLDLIAFLVQRRFPVAWEELAEGVPAYRRKWITGREQDRAAVRRMFERDKDELRALGVPLDSVPYSMNYGTEQATGYRLSSRDFYLPYLRLLKEGRTADAEGEDAANGIGTGGSNSNSNSISTSIPTSPAGEIELTEDEATAAIDALRRVADLPGSPFADAARSGIRKLAFDLDLDALAPTPVLYLEPPGAGDVRDALRSLLEAVRARKTASFTYHGIYRGEATERTVDPYGLLFHHGHWYLVAYCHLREDRRVFRLGRMEGLEVNRSAMKTPDYRIPDGFDLSELAGRDAWELGDEAEPVTARVRFAFPSSLLADRNHWGVLAEALEDGAAIREFTVHQVDPFLRWVLSQAGDASVVGPPELVEAYEELVERTAALYTDSPEGS